MLRLLLLIHRYLGMILGIVILLWCLSGFVMMYVRYPELSNTEQLASLEPLQLTDCCRVPADFSNIPVDSFRVEMLGGRSALRMFGGQFQYVIDLQSGEYLPGFSDTSALAISTIAAEQFGLDGQPALMGEVEQDQWTVYPSFAPHRPLYRFSLGDAPGTELYVSSATGEVVQMTTSRERFWNWIGAVVHWLYPTILRQHAYIWLQTVIWLTIVSVFLTVIGLYIGLRQYTGRRKGRGSPYRGWTLWHHYAGLVFGLFTLTWLVSGLFSVTPWGALEGRSFAEERARLAGAGLDFDSTARYVRTLSAATLPDSAVRVEGSVAGGEFQIIIENDQGLRTRLSPGTLVAQPLPDTFFGAAGGIMRPGVSVLEATWINEGDAYYFNHHESRDFPVFRIRYEDGERLYLDQVSGELSFAADRERQWFRWVFNALHRGDFSALIRSRPIWDLMMWPLMLGVTVGALTGTWIGFRRLVRSVSKPFRHTLESQPAPPTVRARPSG